MWLNMKYLSEIWGSLINIGSAPPDVLSAGPPPSSLQPRSRQTLGWLKKVNLRTLVVIILSALLVYQYYRASGVNILASQQGSASLDISTLVRQVQGELTKSEEQRRANNIAPMFEVGTFELEIGFLVRKSSEVGNKFNYEVVTVDNRVQMASELTHRLKIIMHPVAEYEGSAKSDESQNPTEVPLVRPLPPKKGSIK